MSNHMRQIAFSIDWDKLLAADGSPPYVPYGEAPAPEAVPAAPLIALATTQSPAQRKQDGYDVLEGSSNNLSGIVEAVLYVETRWVCGGCNKRFSKPGRHNAVLRTCACGRKYFLRVVPG